jgi:hypothetical protein
MPHVKPFLLSMLSFSSILFYQILGVVQEIQCGSVPSQTGVCVISGEPAL